MTGLELFEKWCSEKGKVFDIEVIREFQRLLSEEKKYKKALSNECIGLLADKSVLEAEKKEPSLKEEERVLKDDVKWLIKQNKVLNKALELACKDYQKWDEETKLTAPEDYINHYIEQARGEK